MPGFIHSNRNRGLATASLAILTALASTLVSVGANDAFRLQPKRSHTPQSSSPQPPTSYKAPLSEQRLEGGYWRVDHTFRPMLIVTNFLENAALPVTPALYAADGTEYQLPPVTLGPAGVSSIDIIEALNAAPDEIKTHFSEYGSADVKYVWHWPGAVSAMVQNRDAKRSLNFNFELRTTNAMKHAEHAKAKASVKEGLWWKEDPGVKGFLALTNIARRAHEVQVQVLSEHGDLESERAIQLRPKETRVLDLLGDSRGTSGGIRVKYEGSEKDIVLAGGLENPSEGYSAQVPFALPQPDAKLSTVTVSSVGLMIGAPDPMMKFPSSTQFGIYFALRNTTERPVLVKPTAYYMEGNQVKVTNLQALALNSGQARHWSTQEFLKDASLPVFSGTLNLVFSYEGGPSDLLMASGSIDQTNTYVFESDMKAVGQSNAKGLKAWDVSNGNDTMISLLNLAENDQDLRVTFFFGGGQYSYPVHLKADASTMFNVSEVIMMQQPDPDGNTIPPDVTHGSVVLSGSLGYPESINVAVGVGVFNVSTATCGTTCPTCFGYSSFQVQGSNSTAPVGGTATFKALALGQNNVWQDVSNHNNSLEHVDWSSGNSNVATSQGIGNFNGVAPGTFTAIADAFLIVPGTDCPLGSRQSCYADITPGSPAQAGGTITPPSVTIDSFSPDPIVGGGTASVHITVTPSANVSLAISKSGTGTATFGTSGNITMQIPETTTVNITGGAESNGSADLTLSASYGSNLLATYPFSVTTGACTATWTGSNGPQIPPCPKQVTLTDNYNMTEYCSTCQVSCTPINYDSAFTNAACSGGSLGGIRGAGNQTFQAIATAYFAPNDCNTHTLQIRTTVTNAQGVPTVYTGVNIDVKCNSLGSPACH